MALASRAWLWSCVIAATAYAVLSLILFATQGSPIIRSIVDRSGYFLWLTGPAANLVYREEYLLPYAIGTALCCVAFVGAAAAKSSEVKTRMVTFGVVAWCIFGLLVYVPAW